MKLKKNKPPKHKIKIIVTACGEVDLLREKHNVRACVEFDFHTLMTSSIGTEMLTDGMLGVTEAVTQRMTQLYEDEQKKMNGEKP